MSWETLLSGWQIQAVMEGSGSSPGWVTFVSSTCSLILVESGVVKRPQQHSCPGPSSPTPRNTRLLAGLVKRATGLPPSSLLKGPSGLSLRASLLLVKGVPRPGLQMATPTSPPGGQAKSQTLNVQFPHL